jgi:dTDP-4-amino-4,6-dideoxygalactose transaminase
MKTARRRISVGGLKIGPRERRYLAEVIRSSRLSYGPFSERFERGFARAHDCRFAFFCNSGTSALHIAFAALKEEYGFQDGDEVLVPAVTFVATANIVLHNRMTPVFVDVDPKTYNIDARLIEAKITPRTRAIIPVHLMGLPADMDAPSPASENCASSRTPARRSSPPTREGRSAPWATSAASRPMSPITS